MTHPTGAKRTAMQAALHLLLVVWAAVIAFPVVWVYLTSFKTRADAFALPPKWLFTPTLDNYRQVLQGMALGDYFTNSLIVGVSTTVLSVFLGAISAYALTRYVFPGKQLVANTFLATRVLPAAVTVLPLFLLFRDARLLDNYLALILTYTAYNLPLATWLLVGFLDNVPEELEQAAMMDGCSRIGAFYRVTLPLIVPGIAVTSVFALIAAWNEFLFALIFMFQKLTLPVAVSLSITEVGVHWGQATALAGIVLVPVILFTLFVSRYLVEGLTLGAVKS